MGHVLALVLLCRTEGPKDKRDVVGLVAWNHDRQETAVPGTHLKMSWQLKFNLVDFQLQPPVSFFLKSNSGPVQITHQHQIIAISNDVSEKRAKEEGSEEMEADLCPILPAKKQKDRP
ncbi:nucleoplasmin-3-like [Mustela erminea]|uniref:nucleoplasmin-3-like n=1 Tax=Mustela erminea TaxID=36723 RepID=UPI001386CCFC|nr:nucleoplasmin-3-like [Mustela erminea]